MKKAFYQKSISVTDDYIGGHSVTMGIYRHENGHLFAVDMEVVNNSYDDDDPDAFPIIADPYEHGNDIELMD